MNKVNISKVTSSREMNDFLRVPKQIYANCPQYVPDLDSEVRDMFDIRTNPGMEFSELQPFVAYLDGQPVGRIVGIVNRRANEKWNQKVVRFGMIEFIDDIAVSEALLSAVSQWGRQFGMEKIQGPMGVTDFDKEGMLVEDFHLTGTMNTIYNPPYYPRHMERLGYEKEVDWIQVRVQIPQEVPARYARVSQYAREMMGLRVKKLTQEDFDKHHAGRRMFDLLNAAYEPIFGFSALSGKQVDTFVDKYIKLIDKQLLPVVENEQGEMVGIAITMGTLSRAMQKAKGSLLPFGWFHLLRALKWKPEGGAEMLLVAVRPDYQGMGVNAMFFDDLIPIYNKKGITWAETGPQLEDNIRELTQWKPLHPEYVKRRRCYKKSLNIES